MSNLLTSLISTAQALGVFERALEVSQNNVANVSTPGYAAQRMLLHAAEFDPSTGLIGGVQAGEIETARNLYAEQNVRRQCESLGYYTELAHSLAAVESYFDVTGQQGIPAALSNLFQAFSAWSVEPGSLPAREQVMQRAGELADAFHQVAEGMARAATDADRQLRQTVDKINQIGQQLYEYNVARRSGGMDDAGLDTKIHAALEELSELVNISVLHQTDGSVTVLIGGQSPLVIGASLYRISVQFDLPADPPPIYAAAPAPARIVASEGRDITSLVNQGSLGGLLEMRNQVLAPLAGDAYHAGDLNLLAKAVADRINELLTNGWVSEGPPPASGVPLFTYNPASDAVVAQTLALNPAANAQNLAAISPGPPYVGNGVALQLAELAEPRRQQDMISGYSYAAFFGRLAGSVGSRLADAEANRAFRADTAAQARELRQQLSGVSLDQEAILILQFQRAYQANAKMLSLLGELTEAVLGMIR